MGGMEAWFSVLPATVAYIGVVSVGLALVLLLLAALALRRRRPVRAFLRLVPAALFAAVALVVASLGAGLHTYRTLTHEQTAAVVSVEPVGPQRFAAQFVFPDGRKQTYVFEGDQLYVDARILKWKYWANLLGLRTGYELDRAGGRYRLSDDERSKPRTIESLTREGPVDLFALRQRFDFLSPFYDAEYGSATFVSATDPAIYEIQVSTTGLLARPVRSASEPTSQ